MDQTAFLAQMQKALLMVLLASAPALAIAIVIGVTVGLLQALTQIQDQTLPQAVKLITVMLALIVLGPALAVQVANFASNTLDIFPALTR